MIDRGEAALVFIASLILMCVLGWLAGQAIDYIKGNRPSWRKQLRRRIRKSILRLL